ncbi:hypothetical protein HDV02_001054 [Globomyces sp. JEL0801]|nr:hypothetical protein HDV02_001054 [Globomyces sp. JEL0801]
MHYLLLFLFLSRGLSRSVLESQWLVSNACSGPPDLMKVFEYIEPKPMDDENHFFNLFRDFTSPIPYQIGSCGYLSETLSDSCCYVSIDPDEIVDITSASPIVIDSVETDFSQHMYKSANEYSYCSIKPISDTFFGNFEAVMFLASTTCIDYYYKCESNGMFTYYMEEGCQGDFLAIELKEDEQLFNTTDYGIFNGGDKAYFAVLCLLGFLRSIHFTLNLLILDRIPVIFHKSVNKIKDFNRINRAMESQMTDSKTH